MAEIWRKCSSCKNDIMTGQNYYVCSVSTCRGAKTNYAFCSVNCWDAHVPIERHRGDSAGALEKRAPTGAEVASAAASAPRKVIPGGMAAGSGSAKTNEDEVLVVVSKVRKYIADRSGMNTSASLYDALTEKLKKLCDRAIEEARTQGRKTVMDRDVH